MAMSGHTGPPGDGGAEDGFEDLLPCGRSLYAVWEDHEPAPTESGRGTPSGPDSLSGPGSLSGSGGPGHPPADCPHCRAALQELRALDDFVQQARTEDENAPPPDAAAVAARVMDLVRLELRPGRTLPLGEPDEEHWIVEAAAARTLRSAAESVPGVRAGSCRAAQSGGPSAGPRAPVRVTIEVEAGAGRALPALAEAVRAAVAGAADLAIGMRVDVVDVRVVDLFDEAEAADRAHAAGRAEGFGGADGTAPPGAVEEGRW